MNLYETEDGSRIFRAKVADTDGAVILDTEDGEVKTSLWSGRVVGGVAYVNVQELSELVTAPMGEWVKIRRG